MERALELIEDHEGKLSSTKVCTYIAVLTLAAVLVISVLRNKEPSGEIAFTLSGLALGTLITNRTADVKIAQVNNPTPPANQNVTVNQPGVANVAP